MTKSDNYRDDSGMEIEALNGEPGVFTRRWSGREMSDQEIVDYCLKKLENKANRGSAIHNMSCNKFS